MKKRLVCLCNLVSEVEILMFLKKGAGTTEKIRELTRAGTTCGRCLPEIDAIIVNFQKNHPKTRQGKLVF